MNGSLEPLDLLLVDDEPIMQKFLQTFIDWEKIGFRIADKAGNGKQALEIIRSKPVSVVVTDICMPVMDGLELAGILHAMHPHIKVVLMSAHSDFKYARKGIEYGVYSYILKTDDEESVRTFFQRLHTVIVAENNHQSGASQSFEDNAQECHRNRILSQCLRYIQDNYHCNIGLKDLSEVVHAHPQHISRLFTQELGKTFSDVCTETRLKASTIYLKNTSMKIYEIAEIVGYSKPAYYSELFKRQYGCTPFEYRDQLLTSSGAE